MKEYVFVNDTFTEKEKAGIGLNDLALQRGYGIFDFFKTIGSRPIFLDDHLDRFYQSASRLRLNVGYDRDSLKGVIHQLMAKNKLPDSGIRINLSGGPSEDGYTITKPGLVITQNKLVYDPSVFEKGLRLMSHEYQRQFPDVKTIDYLQAIWLQPLVKEKECDDIVYHHQGKILECPRANIFLVMPDGQVLTPAEHILPGITRKQLLKFATFKISEAAIPFHWLKEAVEIFITSTTKWVLPVLYIDGKPVGNAKPGTITRQLHSMLSQVQQNNPVGEDRYIISEP